MAGYGDAAHVGASGELGDGGCQVLEVVEHSFGILDSEATEPTPAGVALRYTDGSRVEMGGLNHHKAMSRPEVGQRTVAVHRGAESMEEDDDRQIDTGSRRRNLDLQVRPALRCRQRHGLY